MTGPCLCGDTHCPSCGPAQGNWRCPICRCWADDVCEHLNEDGSDLKPEYLAEAQAIAAAEAQADQAYAEQLQEDLKLIDAWVAGGKQ
jgi:hypothetical protein